MGTEPLEFHDLSIFNAKQPDILKEARPVTSLKYVPYKSLENLITGGKTAIKTEVNVLKERAEIEQKYAKALREFDKKYKHKMCTVHFNEHYALKKAAHYILEDGRRRAHYHEQLVIGLTGGTISDLQGFLNQGNNSSTSFLNLSGDSVGGRFGRALDDYTDALQECIRDVRKALESKTHEMKLKETLRNKEDMLNASENPQCLNQRKSLHHAFEEDIATIKQKLVSAEAKSKNQYCKARHTLLKREHCINSTISNIALWEKERIRLVSKTLANVLFLLFSDPEINGIPLKGNRGVTGLLQKISSAEYATEEINNWNKTHSLPFIPEKHRHNFHLATGTHVEANISGESICTESAEHKPEVNENKPETETQTAKKRDPIEDFTANKTKDVAVVSKDGKTIKSAKATFLFSTKEVWDPKGSAGCTKSENDLVELRRLRNGKSTDKGDYTSINTSSKEIQIKGSSTKSGDDKIQDGGGGETTPRRPTPKPHLSHYNHFRNYIGKVIYAAFDIDGTGKYTNYPEGGLKLRKGQAVILHKFIGERNLGFGCVKTKLIVGRKKYGYFHLSQMTTVKPI